MHGTFMVESSNTWWSLPPLCGFWAYLNVEAVPNAVSWSNCLIVSSVRFRIRSLRYEGRESGVRSMLRVDLHSSWFCPTMSRLIPAMRCSGISGCSCR